MNNTTAEVTLTMIHLKKNHESSNFGDFGVCWICVPWIVLLSSDSSKKYQKQDEKQGTEIL